MERAHYTEQTWTEDITETAGGDYDISIDIDTGEDPRVPPVELDSPSDASEAVKQARNCIADNSALFDHYDSIQVHDTRNFDGTGGIAYRKSAGTEWGISYVDSHIPGTWNQRQASAHELCHTYGGVHPSDSDDPDATSTFEATELHGSLMLNWATTSCEGHWTIAEPSNWYSDCTKRHVRDYMDSNNLK